jgi:hypothetical protein
MAGVTAQALIEALPAPAERQADAPMKGRNLLVFADSRQDAAFFAPFFERTSRDQAIRAAVVRALARELDEDLDLRALRDVVWRELRRDGFQLYDRRDPEPMSSTAAKDRLLALLAAEFCSGGMLRLSLEALGLAAVGYEGEAKIGARLAEIMPQLAKEQLAPALVRFLLNLVRQSRAINSLELIDLTDESIWGEGLASTEISWAETRTHASRRLRTLLPERGRTNRALWVLAGRLGMPETAARDLLSAFWDEATRPRHKLLVPGGYGYVLNVGSLRFARADQNALWRCPACGGISQTDIDGVCTAYRCTGKTELIGEPERSETRTRNHYITRYTGQPKSAIAREHTAAIGVEERSEIEEKFRQGDVIPRLPEFPISG